jgi:hypothetical protein
MDFGLWTLDFGLWTLNSNLPHMFLRAVKCWILLSTLASVAGWTLSALGMLNKTGYAIFAAAVAVLIFAFRKSPWFSPSGHSLKKLPRRFRHFLPASFALLATLVFLSGLLYAPTDHTGLSYRLPRVLHWLQHGRWFWIHTPNYRMNDRACGIEWLSAPLLLFLKSDRALFLLNFIPFILMPGQLFSVWTRFGVRPRVAWNWMWLFPTGYCFLLQAGGIANDGFPTIYALAMMDFALRAREKFRQSSTENTESRPASRSPIDPGPWTVDLGLSVLSAALLVGAKVSNAPLGLAWVIIIFPLLPKVLILGSRGHGPRTTHHVSRFTFHVITWLLVLLIAILISFLPTAILNMHFLHGDWSGLSIEHPGMDMKNPIAGILGNAVLLVTNNFVPTFFPMAHWWNEHALSHFPAALARLMNANFEGGYNILGEMPTEDSAGIGFGISMLLAISFAAALLTRNTQPGTRTTHHAPRSHQLSTINYQLLLAAPWIGLLAYCMKSGMVTPARLIAPYYPLLFPLLLIGAGQSQVVRRRWWRVLAAGLLLLALALAREYDFVQSRRPPSAPAAVVARAKSLRSVPPTRRPFGDASRILSARSQSNRFHGHQG